MTCSECGAAAVVAMGQRYCHLCGALLPHGAPGGALGADSAGVTAPYLVVGDGSDRAMSALSRQLTLEWFRDNKGRFVVYGGTAAVAVIAALVLVVVVVSALIALVTMLAPVALALIVIFMLARPRRRRRRLARIYRF